MKNIEIFTVYKFNHNVIHYNLEGISHEESLAAPAGGGKFHKLGFRSYTGQQKLN
jgi:hypothetical protein